MSGDGAPGPSEAPEPVDDVLGTPIRRGRPADRALLVSDLHLGASDDPVLAALGAVIDAARERCAALFVLGDLFDSYVSRAQVRVGVWADVAARFRDAGDHGVRVVMLVGNRDFLLGDEFVRASAVELVHGGYRAKLGGVDTLMLHGDELCQNDLPYQRAKRWLRHPLTRGLARRLPLAMARSLAERARRRSRRVIQSGDQTRFLPSERAVAAAFGATGCARLVFGHIHRHAAGPFGDGGSYHVLPAFEAGFVGLELGADGATSTRFAPGAPPAPAEAPPACPWSP